MNTITNETIIKKLTAAKFFEKNNTTEEEFFNVLQFCIEKYGSVCEMTYKEVANGWKEALGEYTKFHTAPDPVMSEEESDDDESEEESDDDESEEESDSEEEDDDDELNEYQQFLEDHNLTEAIVMKAMELKKKCECKPEPKERKEPVKSKAGYISSFRVSKKDLEKHNPKKFINAYGKVYEYCAYYSYHTNPEFKRYMDNSATMKKAPFVWSNSTKVMPGSMGLKYGKDYYEYTEEEPMDLKWGF